MTDPAAGLRIREAVRALVVDAAEPCAAGALRVPDGHPMGVARRRARTGRERISMRCAASWRRRSDWSSAVHRPADLASAAHRAVPQRPVRRPARTHLPRPLRCVRARAATVVGADERRVRARAAMVDARRDRRERRPFRPGRVAHTGRRRCSATDRQRTPSTSAPDELTDVTMTNRVPSRVVQCRRVAGHRRWLDHRHLSLVECARRPRSAGATGSAGC